MSDKPKTKKECFAQLDEMLSEEDKMAIMQAEDTIEFHFSLGLWIRNNWLYDSSPEDVKNLYKTFGLDTIISQPDELSSELLEAYQKYLRRKHK
jgi:hypothetical protein